MEDAQIVALYWDRDEAALAESERKYGGYCRAIALGILERPCRPAVRPGWIPSWES